MNFEFYNPTHLVFGAGSLSRLGEMAIQYGQKAFPFETEQSQIYKKTNC